MSKDRWSVKEILKIITKEDIINEIEYFIDNNYEEDIECKEGKTRFFNITNIEKYKNISLPTKYLICSALRKKMGDENIKSNKFNPNIAISVIKKIFGKLNITEIDTSNAKKYVAIIPNNPNRNDARLDLERDGFYKGWGGGLSCVLVEGQYIILYISADVQKYQYLCRITKIHKDSKTFDFELIIKFNDELSSKFSRKILLELGLAPTGVIRYCLDKYPNICQYVSDLLIQHNIIEEKFWCDEDSDNAIKKIGKEEEMSSRSLKSPLNQILYGPPGTGKTYNTINKALEIILPLSNDYDKKSEQARESELVKQSLLVLEKEKNEEESNRDILKACFDYFVSEDVRQIEFVTFHQSYGYEEFVEGIKADTNEREEVIYEKKDGTFKELSELAKKNFLLSNKKDGHKIDYELLMNNYATHVKEKIDKDEFVSIDNSSYQLISIKEDSNENVKSFIVGKGNHTQNLTKKIILRDIEKFFDEKINVYTDISPTYKSKKSHHGNGIYYFEIYKLLKKFYEENKDLYQIREDELKNYILIIDEINRGNISKIFGELITLIEPSKRIGEGEVLSVKLPYSGDNFGVPSNLYIIGTMNTADRSIAQIDTALRRRFVFEEMMPKPELLVNKDKSDLIIMEGDVETQIDVKQILASINERIEYIYDREHTIGHSYFMPLIETPTKDKLDEIFRVNIIPLLAEYFYGDWNDIKVVLNDTENEGEFIIKESKSKYSIKNNRQNNTIFGVKVNAEGNVDFSVEGYKSIYTLRTE